MAEPVKRGPFAPSGFFVIRTPLLPLREFLDWSGASEAAISAGDPAVLPDATRRDKVRLRAGLAALFTRPEVREALFVASPSLFERSDLSASDAESDKGQKTERALLRYWARMCSRPTPFGLFAACSVGPIGREPRLTVAARQACQRRTRLDMYYLTALVEALEQDAALRDELSWRPNSSLYEIAGRIHYAEARTSQQQRSFHLVAVEATDYLRATLERARAGATVATLAEALVADDPDVTLEEAREFVASLIASQVLVSELAPHVTGPEPIHGVIERLAPHAAAAEASAALRRTRDRLAEIDAGGLGVDPQRYRDVAEGLASLPAKVEIARLFQVDSYKPAPEAMLGQRVVDELARGIELLRRLGGRRRRDDRLAAFRAAFANRYEAREVPLVEVLDEEFGIGFERSDAPSAEASPLLADLNFPAIESEGGPATGPRDVRLLELLHGAIATGSQQVILTDDDVKALSTAEPPPLPDAFAVMARIAAASDDHVARGDFRLLFDYVSGPSGALLLGRFCHGDARLADAVRQHLRAEEALQPDAIFAEIVHLPEGRLGNVLLRPVLREHEICYLGSGSAAAAQQLPIADLLLTVRGERVVLRSRRLGREIVPRLTSAHNFEYRSLGIYRFLCALQSQGVAGGLGWQWGALEAAPFLPRVAYGKLVLARARWRISEREIKSLNKPRGAEQFAAFHTWRRQRGLPRLVVLADADNELLLDLDNVLCVETLLAQLDPRPEATLVELFPGPDELCASGPEGRFTHELVVPFVASREPTPSETPPPAAATPIPRNRPPGSDCLYLKLYCGHASVDRLLTDFVRPLVDQAEADGALERWFFIRYGDPDWHLRLRLLGRPDALHEHVLPRAGALANDLLERGLLWRMQADTYQREIERYGGPEAMAACEQIFHADSRAVLAICETLSGDEGAEARWRLALRGCDRVLADLGLDLAARRKLARELWTSFSKEHRVNTPFQHELSERYRKLRPEINGLLEERWDAEHPLAPGFELLAERSCAIEPAAAELRRLAADGRLATTLDDLGASLVHMHVNRLLRSAQRAAELVMYFFLDRHYDSQLARQRDR